MATRTLVLIRHAKAADGVVDVERPLAPRGVRDAQAIGVWLAEIGVVPDLVVVSPAVRARQTWDAAAASLPGSPRTVIDDRIYDNAVDELLDIVHETPDEVGSLALVGHNPSFGELAYQLDDEAGDPEARQDVLAGFPTSAVAVFDISGAWRDVRLHGGTLRHCAAPRG
jgi:phosphohistidine phosphatase